MTDRLKVCDMARPGVRQQIVDASLQLFLGQGFSASSVQAITAAAGVPKGSFYNHFESKEALGAEIVDLYGAANPVRDVLKDVSLAPLDRLRAHFLGLADIYTKGGFSKGCLIGNFSAEMSGQSDLIRRHVAGVLSAWTADIESALVAARKQGAISKKLEPKRIAAYLLDGYEGALLRARVEQSRDPLDAFISITFDTVLK